MKLPSFFAGALPVIALIALPLFAHLDHAPLNIWDESRLAISAGEMIHNNNWLIPKVNGAPDMWSTKPPLMIWLQAIAMKALGECDLAVRLPAALGAAATCLLLYWLLARKLQQWLQGFTAVALLAASFGFLRVHAVRTGDYDALLMLLSVGYAFFWFLYLDECKRRHIWYAIVCLVFAGLTKGVQGLLFLPGLLLYTAYKKKLLYVVRQKELYFGIGVFLLLVVGYYFLREHYNPGYIAAVQANELGGRYNTVLENHHQGDLYYLDTLIEEFSPWYLLVLPGIILGLAGKDSRLRDATLLSAVLAISYTIIIARAQTQLFWYLLPALPFYALLAAIPIAFVCRLMTKWAGREQLVHANAVTAALLVLILYRPYADALNRVLCGPMEFDEGTTVNHKAMKLYMRELGANGSAAAEMSFLDVTCEQDFWWYSAVLRHQGKKIVYADTTNVDANALAVVYEPRSKEYIGTHFNYRVLQHDAAGITLYKLNGRKN